MEYLNSGALFNAAVKKSEKSPDFWGELLIDLNGMEVVDGKVKVSLSGWKKTSKAGKNYVSIAVSQYRPNESSQSKGGDNDVPF